MKRFISLPKETLAYLVILLVVMISAMIREINLLIILAGLMVGPLLVNWQVVRMTLGKLSCQRKLPDTLYPGELINVDLIVGNERKRLDSWALVVEDTFVWQGTLHNKKQSVIHASVFLPNVKPGKSSLASYRGRLWRRGLYKIGPIKISTRVPLGLFKGTIVVPNTTDEFLVYPRLGNVTKRWNELVKVNQMGHRSSRRNQGQMEGDFFGLRGWRTGDSRRWIHWRSTAKRNELVVRQFEQTRNQNFVILLDLLSNNDEAIETAISFVASVVVEHCRRNGGNLILGICGPSIRFVRGSASNAFISEALEVLAVAHKSDSDQLPELIDEGMTALTSDDRLVIVTTSPVDVQDTSRFELVWNDRQKRRAFTKAVCVDVTDSGFSNWFSFDDTNSASVGRDVPVSLSQKGV